MKINRLPDHPDIVIKLERQAKIFNARLENNTRPLGMVLPEEKSQERTDVGKE